MSLGSLCPPPLNIHVYSYLDLLAHCKYSCSNSNNQFNTSRQIFKMAPSILETQPDAPHTLTSQAQKIVDRKVFPDGIKTSGQHPPLYNKLRPYSDFPTEIIGESVWRPEDYTHNPERWVHVFDEEEVAELSSVADKFLADKIPLTGISKVPHHCQPT